MTVRNRTAGLLSTLAIAALALAGCGTDANGTGASATPGDTVSVNNVNGSTTDVPLRPQRVVVLDAVALDTLNAMGVDDVIVGTAGEFTVGKTAEDAVTVVDEQQRTIDVEKLESVKPDLVISGDRFPALSTEDASTANEQAIEQAVPDAAHIEINPYPNTAQDLRDITTTLGDIFEKKAEAATLVSDFDAAVAKARTAIAKNGGKALTLLTFDRSLSDVAARFNIPYEELGFAHVDIPEDDTTPHGGDLSYETIRQIDPDWILVIDRNQIAQGGAAAGTSAKELLDNDLIRETTAGSKDQIIYLDVDQAYLKSSIVSWTALSEDIAAKVGSAGS